MRAIDTLTNVAGLYGLTPDGELGAYTEDRRFVVDASLTQAFAAQIRQLLRSYLADPNAGLYRLGLMYRSPQPRPWGTDTLVLEESVVREVYPVSGRAARELTAFQKKNREKSIYRGIELLVEYRHEGTPDSPVYCPLLYERGTMLDQYPPELGFAVEGGAGTPVVELLNLAAILPMGRRNTPELLALMNNMHRYLVRKEARRDGLFTLRQESYVSRADAESGPVEFFDADKRHERPQTLEPGMLAQRLAAAEQSLRADRLSQVDRWLEYPHRAVDAARLRAFVQFRTLDEAGLAALAARALLHAAPAGVRLLDIGMKDPWNLYLLEGTVSLRAADGGALLVTGGTDKAANPVSFLKPRKYEVTAVTPVSFLWIHDALLAALAAAPGPAPRAESQLKPKGF